MITFIGEYEARLDDKGRVVFPSAFRNLLPAGSDMRFVIKKDTFSDCLEMYAYEEWEKQSAEVKSRLNVVFNREHAMFWRKYMSGRAVVEPDTKVGRMSIPQNLLEIIGVKKEIVFLGNDYKIEIWAKEKFNDALISDKEYLDIAEKLSEQR